MTKIKYPTIAERTEIATKMSAEELLNEYQVIHLYARSQVTQIHHENARILRQEILRRMGDAK